MTWPFRPQSETAIAAAAAQFASAQPFPHVVLDGWFEEDALARLLGRFDDQDGWQTYEDRKRGNSAVGDDPTIAALNSPPALALLERIARMSGLVIDPTLRGGGLHALPRGGRLGIHVDFNRHRDLPLKRCLNTILYLNRTWQDDWQGHLTLTNRERTINQRLAPLWNRWVIFAYGPEAWHGHPEPLECPDGVERRSAAIYYYEPIGDEPLAFTGTQYA